MTLYSKERGEEGPHVLFDEPLPRRIASRPVDWIADTTALGGAVPSMKTNWSLRFASTFFTPVDAKT